MQQPGPMFPVMPSFPPTNITTEQIQKYLDENKKLILAILDNQNLGKLAECAQYQAQLQKNLMYLAAIADAQPQTPAMPAQMSPHPAMPTQGGGFYMPQQQQVGIFPPKSPPPPPFITPHHTLQDLQQQPPVQMALRPPPAGPSNGHGHDTTNRGGTSDAQGNNSAVGDGDETTKWWAEKNACAVSQVPSDF